MDDLCDPDFYLSYKPQPTAPTTPITSYAKRPVISSKINSDLNRNDRMQPSLELGSAGGQVPEPTSRQHDFTNISVAAARTTNGTGSKSVELPRRPFKDLLQQ